MTELAPSAAECLSRVRAILHSSRRQALQTVNAAMVQAYWQIGREIVEEEQRGEDRAVYGARLIDVLSAALTQEYGQGFVPRNLRYMREVYQAFPIWNALRSESQELLSWTHYRLLSRVGKREAREFLPTNAPGRAGRPVNWSGKYPRFSMNVWPCRRTKTACGNRRSRSRTARKT